MASLDENIISVEHIKVLTSLVSSEGSAKPTIVFLPDQDRIRKDLQSLGLIEVRVGNNYEITSAGVDCVNEITGFVNLLVRNYVERYLPLSGGE
jgi:hypothetical protein